MARKNLYPFLTLCSVGLSLCLVLSADLSTQGQESSEQSTNRQTQLNRSVLQVTFDPPGDGEPDNTAGGASRDGRKCSNDAIAPGSPITSLTPATHQG
ncbi:MAG: hypothetical protein LDL41_13915, partial [Coleofasciculus sp. S288]|nr:hypothetical protein [Coleofasciculus sp. S288]